MIKVLFICHGNICRSPMAEFILKDMLKKRHLSDLFLVESAATSDEEIRRGVGNPVYPPARKILEEHGISCDGKTARLLTKADYDLYDYLIGMDRRNLSNMKRICGGDPEGKMSLLLDHTKQPREVSDPWFTRDFQKTWVDISEGCEALLNEWMTRHPAPKSSFGRAHIAMEVQNERKQ